MGSEKEATKRDAKTSAVRNAPRGPRQRMLVAAVNDSVVELAFWAREHKDCRLRKFGLRIHLVTSDGCRRGAGIHERLRQGKGRGMGGRETAENG